MRSKTSVVYLATVAFALSGCGAKPPSPDLRCASRPAQVLAAQSVPEAQYVPCIAEVLPPWMLMSTDTDQDRTQVVMEWSSSSNATERALVTLQSDCSQGGSPVTNTGMPAGIDISREVSGRTVTTVYMFEGGCVQVEVTRGRQSEVEALTSEDFDIEFVPRELLNEYVLEQTNHRVGLDPEGGS